jgi:DHA2 family multidrug resistance protein
MTNEGAERQGTEPTAVNPWVVALTVTIATFMELLDTSIANVALPHMAGSLGRSFDEVTWILTTYLVANAVVLPMSAWLSLVFGRKNYYMGCVLLFTLSSLLCGFAPSLPIMLVARVLQGIGGGGLAPVEQSILVDAFPPAKRASAFALYTVAIVVAPAIGPVVGGWITVNFSWRWCFFINIPIGLLSLLLTNRFVQDPPAFGERRKTARSASGDLNIDATGILLLALGSAALEMLLDRGQIDDWFGSPFICWMCATAAVCLVSAVVWELNHKDPVIDFRLLTTRNFAVANVFYFLFGVGLFASTTILPQLLQTLFGYSAMDAGLVLGPGAGVITVLAPVGAILVQKQIVRPKYLLFVATTIAGCSFFYYSRFNLDTNYGHFAFARAFQGFGYAFFFVPLTVITYSELRSDQNDKASSLTNFFRNWGGSFGIALATTIAERRANFHQARLGDNLPATSHDLQQMIARVGKYLQQQGWSQADSARGAIAIMSQRFDAQVRQLAYMDCFWMLGLLTVIIAPIALWTRNFKVDPDAAPGH